MQKLYYSISEISTIVDEEQHILRYWEKEFDGLKPKKNRGGNRIYSRKDLTIIKVIKKLVRSEKLSLKGAKEKLSKILKQEHFNLENYADNLTDVQVSNIIPDTVNSNKSTKTEDVKGLISKEELKEMALMLEDTLSYLKSI